MFKDIATTIADKCVNPETKRPYPVSMIEKAMKECHIAVKPNKSSKQQAIETVGKLQAQIPIERAQMRIKLVVPITMSKPVKKSLAKLKLKTEKDEKVDDDIVMVCLIDPGQYRTLDETFRNETQGKGTLELVNLKEVVEEEEKMC